MHWSCIGHPACCLPSNLIQSTSEHSFPIGQPLAHLPPLCCRMPAQGKDARCWLEWLVASTKGALSAGRRRTKFVRCYCPMTLAHPSSQREETQTLRPTRCLADPSLNHHVRRAPHWSKPVAVLIDGQQLKVPTDVTAHLPDDLRIFIGNKW